MNTATLLEMLVEVERALQRTDYMAAHALVMETEDYILQSQRELIHMQAEKLRLAA